MLYFSHQVLREDLAALDDGGVFHRPEAGDARFRAARSTAPIASGSSGATTTKSIWCSAANRTRPPMSEVCDGAALGHLRDPGVARQRVELRHLFVFGDFNGQRVLAPAPAHDHDVS